MELFMGCVLLAIGLGILIFKTILFGLFMSYPQPGEDLKWKRAPSLPMSSLSRFSRGSGGGSSSARKADRNLPRGRIGGGNRTRPVPPIPTAAPVHKVDFPHGERVPLEVINIDIEDDYDLDRPMRHQDRQLQHQYQRDRDPYGTIV